MVIPKRMLSELVEEQPEEEETPEEEASRLDGERLVIWHLIGKHLLQGFLDK